MVYGAGLGRGAYPILVAPVVAPLRSYFKDRTTEDSPLRPRLGPRCLGIPLHELSACFRRAYVVEGTTVSLVVASTLVAMVTKVQCLLACALANLRSCDYGELLCEDFRDNGMRVCCFGGDFWPQQGSWHAQRDKWSFLNWLSPWQPCWSSLASVLSCCPAFLCCCFDASDLHRMLLCMGQRATTDSRAEDNLRSFRWRLPKSGRTLLARRRLSVVGH